MLQAMYKRVSVRTYDDREFDAELKSRAQSVLSETKQGFFHTLPRFALIERRETERNKRVKLGSYGFIKGARYYVAGAVERSPKAEIDFGFALEKIILELTKMGLGTCWLGGTFSRGQFGKALELSNREFIPAVASVGFPAERRIFEKFVRWNAKSDSRIPWQNLFFEEDFAKSLDKELPGAYAEALEMVRIAPSASNKQPWRVVLDFRGFHFFLLRTKGYRRLVPSVDLQAIDMGIAMCHFEMACEHLRLPGKWQIAAPSAALPPDCEYVVSWVRERG